MTRIQELHARTLNAADEGTRQRDSAVLDDLVGQTRQISNSLKEKIQSLASYPVSRSQDQTVRRDQVRGPVTLHPVAHDLILHFDNRRTACAPVLWRFSKPTRMWSATTGRDIGSASSGSSRLVSYLSSWAGNNQMLNSAHSQARCVAGGSCRCCERSGGWWPDFLSGGM